MLQGLFEIKAIELHDTPRLYPRGVRWKLSPGVNVIVGGTGLGKTTLVNATLFGLFGELGQTSTREDLARVTTDYFADRVAGPAHSPTVSVTAAFGDDEFVVQRGLRDGKLRHLTVGGEGRSPREYERLVCDATGATGFKSQVLRLVDYLLYSSESRYLLSWDNQAQNEVLSLLFHDIRVFERLSTLWDAAKKADSASRNARTRATNIRKDVDELQRTDESMRASTLRAERAEIQRSRADAEARRRNAGIAYEREYAVAQEVTERVQEIRERFEALAVDTADAMGDSADAKLVARAISNPTQRSIFDALLTFATQGGTRECPCCSQQVTSETATIASARHAIAAGGCPICSLSLLQVRELSPSEVSETTIEELEELAVALRAAVAQTEAARSRLAERSRELQAATDALQQTRDREWAFLASNPETLEGPIERKTAELAVAEEEWHRLEATRDENLAEFRVGQGELTDRLAQLYERLAERFANYCRLFLDEDCSVELDPDGYHARRRGPQLDPLHAAFYPVVSGVPRYRPEELSEAQRLFVDLAFRMSVLDVWTSMSGRRASLIIEAPEGTVDIAYMVRVAHMLREFSDRGHTVLITTNLNNDAFLPALLAGVDVSERQERILNLLDLGVPRNVQIAHRADFDAIIRKALAAQGQQA